MLYNLGRYVGYRNWGWTGLEYMLPFIRQQFEKGYTNPVLHYQVTMQLQGNKRTNILFGALIQQLTPQGPLHLRGATIISERILQHESAGRTLPNSPKCYSSRQPYFTVCWKAVTAWCFLVFIQKSLCRSHWGSSVTFSLVGPLLKCQQKHCSRHSKINTGEANVNNMLSSLAKGIFCICGYFQQNLCNTRKHGTK